MSPTPLRLMLAALGLLAMCAISVQAQTYDPDVWLGHYTSTGCDTSACCCMNSVNVFKPAVGAGQWTIGGPLVGQCGDLIDLATSLPAPASDNITYTVGAFTPPQQHDARRDPTTGAVVDTNLANDQCSGELTKTMPTGGDDDATAATIGLYGDASCTVLSAASTQTKGACQRVEAQGMVMYLTATCSGAAWNARAFVVPTSDCTGTPSFQAASVGSEVCAPVGGGAYVRVLCNGAAVSSASRAAPTLLAAVGLAAMAFVAVLAGQQ